jgi:hypothetical protein
MNKLKITFLLLLTTFSISLYAQDTTSVDLEPKLPAIPLDKFSVGAGVGYEYGGGGVNAIFYPYKNIGVFGGAGWNIIGLGYNAGVKIRAIINPASAVFIPFIVGMYGYNTTIYYPNNTQYNKTFYNFTIGGGLDFRPNNSKFGYFSLAVYVPFRNPDVKNYVNNIEYFWAIPYSTNRIFPLSASFGYKIMLAK